MRQQKGEVNYYFRRLFFPGKISVAPRFPSSEKYTPGCRLLVSIQFAEETFHPLTTKGAGVSMVMVTSG